MNRLTDALEMVVRTDPGMVRPINEDAVFVDPQAGLAVLADGMGGYNAGEVASGMATTMLADSLGVAMRSLLGSGQPVVPEMVERQLLEDISAVNISIFNAAENQPQYASMGTTLVVACFYDNHMMVAHLGDSRLYRLRGGHLELLTRDHSLLQEQLDSGMITQEEARHSQNKNLLTRALGVDPETEIEIGNFDMAPGDLVMLCSDGLNGMIDDEEIARILHKSGSDLAQAADELVCAANDNGGRDNVSVILVRVRGDYGSGEGWWHKLLASFK